MLNRVIISGGGTGGHIFPAIAIANEIKSRYPQCQILFVGALGRMEMEKVPQAGYSIIGLPIMGIQRKLTLKNAMVPFKLLASLLKARKIIKDFQPEVCIGVGGYASAAVLWMSTAMKIPSLIQEQNSFAGLTNKKLGKKVDRICVAYEGMERFFPKEKIVMTGNPVRAEIYEAANQFRQSAKTNLGFDPNKKMLLVIGGSLGAATINRCVQKDLKKFYDQDIQVLWQTGKNFKPDINGFTSTIAKDFIKDMSTAYAAADVVVSRAGAISVSELCLLKKPSILVPSPNVAEDHQTQNAKALVNKNAALLVKDSEANEKLVNQVVQLINQEDQLKEMSERIGLLSKPDALKNIVNEIEKIVL
jgi:UDP-N-acetylglucosamine--N-acetylmuramyl-(pentapeptide) pyrophosphoryl-undecaprenol N-acetylglucosamine transferase